MSYTPTEWKTGDVITAPKLNNMESGIVAGQEVFIIHATGVATVPDTPTTPVLDKTYNEIVDAIQNGKIPFVIANSTAGASVIPFASSTSEPTNAIAFSLTALAGVPGNYLISNTSISVMPTVCASIYSQVEIPTNSTGS